MAEVPVLQWYRAMPAVTRVYMTAMVTVALLCHLQILSVYQLYFNSHLILKKRHYWRLFTPFLYHGPMSLEFAFHLFFMMRYGRLLEEDVFRGRTADFLVLNVWGWLCMILGGGFFAGELFLGRPFSFMMVYLWSRHHPHVQMNVFGVLQFTAPYLPLVMFGFAWLLGGRWPREDVLGLMAGHLYWYLDVVLPQTHGIRPLRAPQWLLERFGPPRLADDVGVRRIVLNMQQRDALQQDRIRLEQQRDALLQQRQDLMQQQQDLMQQEALLRRQEQVNEPIAIVQNEAENEQEQPRERLRENE